MPLELVLLDDESDATKTVARGWRRWPRRAWSPISGGFGSDLHAAAASVAEKNKIAYLGIAFALNKIHQQGFRYLFSPFWKSPDIGKHTQGLLRADPGRRAPQDRGDLPGEDRLGPGDGRRVDGGAARPPATRWWCSGEYAPGAKDFSDLILKAKAANAEAVFAIPTPPDGMTMIKQMKELDYTPKMNVMIRAADSPPWTKNLGKDGDYTVLAAGWHNAMKAPGVKELNDAHEKKFGRPSDPIVGPAYACVQILAGRHHARRQRRSREDP